MKTNTASNHPGHKALLLTLTLGLFAFGGLSSAKAGEIFNTDFSKDTFEALGWTPKGDWTIVDYAADSPAVANKPGFVAKFAANGTTVGTLTKKFNAISNPSKLTLTFDAGYGWGAKDHVQAIDVMLLDADGNGYLFSVHRASATWGVQWDKVTKYGHNEQLNFARSVVDTTQASVRDGGGLRTFTITRDESGDWTFDGAGWTGGPLTFTDSDFTAFSQVVLCGSPNNDEILFNKIKLEAAK